ncbi:MAG: hypothetical protein EXR95_10855, partial [Gemmatimonadetes bacterium]|nr:hypothetical protein [Gemmatimonadota bacterium]
MISASEPGRGRRGLGAAGARPALGSVVVHVAAIALAWSSATVRPEMPEFVSYQIDLVSAPAAEDPGMPVVEAIPAPEPPAAADLPPPPVPEKETKPEPAAEPEKAP